MKGRAFIVVPEADWARQMLLHDCEIDASFGDYGRNDNPTLLVQSGETTVSFEFATPDEARVLGERLLALARKAEEKSGQRGPEYRIRLAREEALAEVRSVMERFETVMQSSCAPITTGLAVFARPLNPPEPAEDHNKK